jgi:hypothetical protein
VSDAVVGDAWTCTHSSTKIVRERVTCDPVHLQECAGCAAHADWKQAGLNESTNSEQYFVENTQAYSRPLVNVVTFSERSRDGMHQGQRVICCAYKRLLLSVCVRAYRVSSSRLLARAVCAVVMSLVTHRSDVGGGKTLELYIYNGLHLYGARLPSLNSTPFRRCTHTVVDMLSSSITRPQRHTGVLHF